MQHVRIRYVVVILAMAALSGFRLLPAMAHGPKGDGPQIDTWQTFGFCRKVRFLGQNPKIECREFNDLQTAKLSKKQLCDRTQYPAPPSPGARPTTPPRRHELGAVPEAALGGACCHGLLHRGGGDLARPRDLLRVGGDGTGDAQSPDCRHH